MLVLQCVGGREDVFIDGRLKRAVKRQVWGQGCACAFSNAMCLKRRVPSVGKTEKYPKINSETKPLLFRHSCSVEASSEL